MKIKAIAFNTFKEAIRDRILYLLLFFVVVIFILSRVLALITVGDVGKILMDVGLATLSLFGALMAILMGTGLVYKEIDKKTIYTLLSKPIHRYQFLLGKYLGLIMTLTIMLILMSLMFLLVLIIHSVPIEWGMFIAVAFILLELFLITAVAMFFSCFPTPILSVIFSLAFYLIGHLSWGLNTVIQKMQPGPGKILSQVFYTFLPDLENFNFKTEVVHHLPVLPQIYLFSTVYGVAYILFVLAASMLVFRRRDFI